MELKNKNIDIFGTTYKIRFVDSIETTDNISIFGNTDSSTNTIRIAKTSNGNKISQKEQELTLLHELVHAILFTGQYIEEGSNEALVEWIARCLNQLIKKNII